MKNPFAADVRAHSRLEIGGALSVEIPSLGLVMDVWNVSTGGAQTISRLPFEEGATHGLEFVLRDWADALFLRARVIYCLPQDQGGAYQIGWVWAPDATTTENSRTLMDYLSDVRYLAILSGPKDFTAP